MDDYSLIELSPQQTDRLLYALDGALKVTRRYQFFLWAQGGLQSLVAHETLVCAWGDFDNRRYRFEVFTRAVLETRFTDRLGDPVDGLLTQLVDIWRGNERRITACSTRRDDDTLPARLRNELAHHGVRRVVLHGTRERQGDYGTFFAFFNGAEHFGTHEAYLLDLVLPHLHLAVHRLEEEKNEPPPTEIDADAILSERESQVLQWVREGKTNYEIAQILGISPLTVKNHVQKILRKLKVSNRAQAVAKGVAARLIVASA